MENLRFGHSYKIQGARVLGIHTKRGHSEPKNAVLLINRPIIQLCILYRQDPEDKFSSAHPDLAEMGFIGVDGGDRGGVQIHQE